MYFFPSPSTVIFSILDKLIKKVIFCKESALKNEWFSLMNSLEKCFTFQRVFLIVSLHLLRPIKWLNTINFLVKHLKERIHQFRIFVIFIKFCISIVKVILEILQHKLRDVRAYFVYWVENYIKLPTMRLSYFKKIAFTCVKEAFGSPVKYCQEDIYLVSWIDK